MIVKMSKISLVMLDSCRDRAIEELGRLGVVHLEPLLGSGERLEELRARVERAERASRTLARTTGAPRALAGDGADAPSVDGCADDIVEAITKLEEERAQLLVERAESVREAERLLPWGSFDPADVLRLREAGVDLRLYIVTPERLDAVSRETPPFVHFRAKSAIGCSATSAHDRFRSEELFALPGQGLDTHRRRIREVDGRIEEIEARLSTHSGNRELLRHRLRELRQNVELEEIRTGMGREESLAYLTGYVPVTQLAAIKERAKESGWGLLCREPEPDDAVPTLIENPKWIRIIQPMFSLLGLVPGYREFDISPVFLVFFSIFFALLIGDAAYGLVFLAGTIVARVLLPKARREYFAMMYVFSICTIVWGSVTGTWFGSEALSHSPLLSRLIVPQLYSFNSGNNPLLMFICFSIAIAHLSIAHLMNFVKKLPALRAFEDVGSLLLVWGLYFLVIYLVVKRPLQPVTVWLIVLGLVGRVVFSNQSGHFIRDALRGLAKLPLLLLNSVSSFSDIVSYVRLFAVGLATVAVAQSFNGMAAGLGHSVFSYVGMALILVVGHGLNVTLGALALIVHGVRLNLLEFSGHLEMEWTGTVYRPFKIDRPHPDEEAQVATELHSPAEPERGSDTE